MFVMTSVAGLRRRWIAVVLGCVLGVFILPPPAAAHTELISSDPAADATLSRPPARITLTFNEPMEPRLAVVTLTIGKRDPDRLDVTAGADATELVATVPDGIAQDTRWRVAFRVTSADGHPVQGDLAFSVKSAADGTSVEPGPEPPVDQSPPRTSPVDSEESAPVLLVVAGVVGGGALLLTVLFLIARYLRAEES